jgi:PHD/YefM family antitoxin component YafN of YafNO toxin-antitoxin module
MIKVSSSEFLRGYGSLSDRALVEPVTITRNGRDRLVVVSAEAYAEFQKAAGLRSRAIEDLEESEIEALAQAQVPEAFAPLDDEAHA